MNKDNPVPFWHKSYKNHFEYERTPNLEKLETWKNFETVDAWRHRRMYDCVLPLIKTYPLSRWLTIGDGRYGTDANYLIRNNISDVLATSISDVLLKKANEDGFISDYKIENAESLSFDDDSFDFVFCKESYHHFPRPMVAFYEMLRVASKAVVIIEPNDVNLKLSRESKKVIQPKNKRQLIKDFIKDILGIRRYGYHIYIPDGYETSGNYIYTTSEREFEKAALGLNLPLIAFKGLNDYYEEGMEFEKPDEDSLLFNKIKTAIAYMDADCKRNDKPYNILVSIIFKTMPEAPILDGLNSSMFKVYKLSRNPYNQAAK
ncbi:MAG: methyltransferase domain-containing protein [Ginsengibacter sp.]